MKAYQYVLDREGYWVNHGSDYGLETYRGISFRYNPSWKGWEYINQYKRTHRLKWNDSIPGDMLKWHIMDHYLSIWCSENFMYISDDDIATYTFDFRINSQYLAIKTIQETLNEMDYPTEITGIMDMETVSSLNICPKWEFIAKLMENRLEYYTNIVNKYPSQRVFYQNWVMRSKLNH